MKKIVLMISVILLVSVISAGALQAATVDFWFAKAGDATGTAITSLNVITGATFGLSVWYKTDVAFDHTTWETMLGFDRSTTMGTSATALDHKLALNGTATTAVTNLNSNFATKLIQTLAGGRAASSTTGSRPYGLRISYAIAPGTSAVSQTTGAKLYDVSLVNNMLAGNSYDTVIWNYGSGASYTSFLMNANATQIRDNATLRVTSIKAVPEASSLLAFGVPMLMLGLGKLKGLRK